MNIKNDGDGYLYNFDNSDSEYESLSYTPLSSRRKLTLIDRAIKLNEEHQQNLQNFLIYIDESLRLNNLKLEIFDYIKRQRKNQYKKRSWFDTIEFYEFDKEVDRLPEPLRILKMLNLQNLQNKKNAGLFNRITKMEVDDIIFDEDDCDDSLSEKEEEFFFQRCKMEAIQQENKFNLLNLNSHRKKFVFDPKLESFIKATTIESARETDWIGLAKKANTKLKRKDVTGLELFQIYKIKLNREKEGEEWTEEEDNILKMAIEYHGTHDWKQIANYLDGKDTSCCFQRWFKHLNQGIKKGRWEMKEDLKVALYMELYGKNKWANVAQKFHDRTDVQIRERWCNILDPQLKVDSKWTLEEDQLLLEITPKLNQKWAQIKTKFEGRTDNQCYRRFKKLKSENKKSHEIKQKKVKERKDNKKKEDIETLVSKAVKTKKKIFKIEYHHPSNGIIKSVC